MHYIYSILIFAKKHLSILLEFNLFLRILMFKIHFDDGQKKGKIRAHVGVEGDDALASKVLDSLSKLESKGAVHLAESYLPGCQLVEFNSLDKLKGVLREAKDAGAEFAQYSEDPDKGFRRTVHDAQVVFDRSVEDSIKR